MESSPGLENRKQYNKLKEIGTDKLASMQAAAQTAAASGLRP